MPNCRHYWMKIQLKHLQELAETLKVGKSTFQSFTITKIQKEGKWVPHELFKLAIQNLTICTSLLSCHKKKQFL